ncbi:elongation factor P hydroxylase [Acinetobacter baumannii]|uniref:elongation factor P hydroxylase n=1 Tax=Acinetobacter baumannii TaxID=470 RepID=UPI003AAD187B
MNGYLHQSFGRKFRVSLDNLTGDGGDGRKFKDNVYAQVHVTFLVKQSCLPMQQDSLNVFANVREQVQHYN